MERRFNEMIAACKRGEYDLIVTKSVSRFARNLVDCISLIRMLKGQVPPVGVFFETDNLYTLAENTEFMLSFLATFAQEESVKKSEAIVFNLPNAVPAMLIPTDDGDDAKHRKRITLCPEEWENDFGEEFYEHTVENGFYYIAPNTEWHSQVRSVVAPGIEQYAVPSQEQLQMTIDDLLRGTNRKDGNEGN